MPFVSKPARYTGGEWNSFRKDWDDNYIHFALAFPDVYEIGSSHLGLQILYELLNTRRDVFAERVFAPWIDMEGHLRRAGMPLFALESRKPIASFDILGFTLPYELTYTNVINMLDLAGIPVHAGERSDHHPLIIAGGNGAFTPEPIADFVDLFVVGDGEEVVHELVDAFRDSGWRPRLATNGRGSRDDFLRSAARITGIYVPSLYAAKAGAGGSWVEPTVFGAPRRVTKRFLRTLPFAPVRPVVPFVAAVHDRAAVEIMRGCARGCRFCQAGIIYRSVRERPLEETVELIDRLVANTGYNELGLVSLSSADYSQIEELVRRIVARHPDVSISLPSLRVDAFSVELAGAIRRRKAGFTFAPEAGSQRMRDVVNKHVSADDILRAGAAAFGQGWSSLKLYFMIGLPGETLEDVASITAVAREMLAMGRRHRGPRAQLHVSASTFSPKPHSPFQWVAQDSPSALHAKHELLKQGLRGIKLSWSDTRTSFLETTLARGDRRLGRAILEAWRGGARFDAWTDQFNFDSWQQAFERNDIDVSRCTQQPIPVDAPLPWDHINSGVSKTYLEMELGRSLLGQFTPDCHVHGRCSACGHFVLYEKCLEAMRRDKMATNV